MTAGNLFSHLDVALRIGTAVVDDPGSAGTIVINNKGFAVCEVITAGAETRVLDDADVLPVGQKLLVCLKTAAGALTIDSDDNDVVLSAAGECAEFTVTASGSGKVWKSTSVGRSTDPVEVTGARDTPEEALANLLTALETLGLITDSTTAS